MPQASDNANCGMAKNKYIRIPDYQRAADRIIRVSDKYLIFWYAGTLRADVLMR
jgi:hypothetical protein